MLEHKVVNKTKECLSAARIGLVFLSVVAVTFGSISEVDARRSRRPASRSQTVGDVLKGIEKKANKVNLKKSKSSLPQFQKFKEHQKNVNLGEVAPPSRGDLFYGSENTDEVALEKVTDQGIRQLYKLTRQFKNSSRRGELWLRLAELYVEKARLIEYRLQTEYDKKLAAFDAGKIQTKPRLNLRPAQIYNKRAIRLYEWFLRDFPKDDKVDQALFFLGYNYFELGNTQKGRAYYERLTKQFPKSPYVDESNFALGEYYFENEKWAKALPHYQKVARNRRARLFSFALYKSAWCQYKTGQIKDGLKSLEMVIRAGRAGQGNDSNSGVSRIRLASEAKKDLVIFYAEAGDYRGARSYFGRIVGGKHVYGMLEKLAYYYSDTGNKPGARYVFKELIREKPNAPKAYDYQYQVVNLYATAGYNKIFRQELYNWIDKYGPESVWARANAQDKDLVSKASQLIETTLRNYILQQHQTAQNSRAPFSQKLAKSGYELYFTTFKNSPRLDEMHFFFGELLFDMQEWERAAYHYSWIADNTPKSDYYERAMLNTILALEKKLPTPEEIKKIVGKSTQPLEFDRTLKLFEKAATRYFTKFPQGEDAIAVKYRLGSLYYYYNQFDKAIAIFTEVIEKHPDTKYAEYSANLILDIYNIKKDYTGLEKAAKKILSIPAIASSDIGPQIKEIMERSSFKRAESLEKNKDYRNSARSYEDFARKNPNSDMVTGAYYNAAVNYERAGDLTKAINMYNVVVDSKDKKHAGLRRNSRKYLAALYEKTGQYARAATAFETYASQFPDDSEASDFWYNAAVIRHGMEFYKVAIRNYKKYYNSTKKKDREEAYLLMAQAYEEQGKVSLAAAHYKKYMDLNPANAAGVVEAAFKIAKLNERLNRNKTADEWYGKTVGIQRRLAAQGKSVGVTYAAEAKFRLVYNTYEKFRRIDIPGGQKAQARAVQQKLNMLDKLNAELKDVIAYDDGYQVVASLALLGQAYQHLSASIYNAPLPKGLSGDTLKEYKAGVEQIARPFQEQAISNYKSAVEKGFRLQGYNEWLKVAMKELNNLKSDEYPDSGERVILTKVPDWMGI